MHTPVRITFRDMEPSAALEHTVHSKLEWLELHHAGITSCHVVIEAPHARHRHGGHFRVCVQVGFRGAEIVASRSPAARADHADCHLAVRDAFRAARRQLEHGADRQRSAV